MVFFLNDDANIPTKCLVATNILVATAKLTSFNFAKKIHTE